MRRLKVERLDQSHLHRGNDKTSRHRRRPGTEPSSEPERVESHASARVLGSQSAKGLDAAHGALTGEGPPSRSGLGFFMTFARRVLRHIHSRRPATRRSQAIAARVRDAQCIFECVDAVGEPDECGRVDVFIDELQRFGKPIGAGNHDQITIVPAQRKQALVPRAGRIEVGKRFAIAGFA